MRPDQSNSKIIHNYVAMPDRSQFCADDVVSATGVNIRTVRNVLPILEKKGYLVRAKARVNGRVYYRLATAEESSKKAKQSLTEQQRSLLRKRILNSMTPGVWYSSLRLRIEAAMPEVDFKFLETMAKEGLLEGLVHQLPGGNHKSYYWRKKDGTQR